MSAVRANGTCDCVCGQALCDAVRSVEEEGKRAQRHYRRSDLEKLKAKSPNLPRVIQNSSSERRFFFQVREGAITISLPRELGEESAEILRSFLDLVIASPERSQGSPSNWLL